MSPYVLADEPVTAVEQDPGTEPDLAPPARPRLTVREMQIALDAARSLAHSGHTGTQVPSRECPPREGTERGGADRSHAAPCHDALEGSSSVPPAIREPWLPERDGPVSLTEVAAPRTHSVRRAAAARPDKAPRGPSARQRPSRPGKAATIAPELAAAVAADPPRIVVVPACGGAGATTTAVLLAAGLAPACGAILLAGGPDRGSLAVRSNAEGGDLDALTASAREHPHQPLQIDTPGVAIGTSGQDRLVVAAESRRREQPPLTAASGAVLLTAATATGASVVLDWCTSDPVPDSVWAAATCTVVVAPATSPGLLDAEYTIDELGAARPAHARLRLVTIDVRGRAPRRAGRAALARLRALRIPVAAVPFDPALADDPRVHWPSLRPRTRAAVLTALTQMLQREDEK
jgi:hypothetical protein